eukprot:jgi/Chrpa1/8070/Chrysochromulina_OHIO_Genome00000199-RA
MLTRAALALCCLIQPAATTATTDSATWTGLMGLTFESDVPVERRAMHCPSGYITGLQVRHGRDSKADTDMYDFKLKCGGRWGPWSGMTFSSYKEEKAQECPLKMHMTGLEVKQGRKEIGDVDTYDFKLQCSGVWQPYMGLTFSNQQNLASKECPPGTMAFGWRAYRGFVKRGDRDFYEFDLNCKSAEDAAEAVRRSPSLHDLGLPQNVFVWSTKDVSVWLGALGLSEYAAAFVENKLQGDVIFLLLESHLQDLGMNKIGDRLYFMEVLTQLHDSTNRLAKTVGQLASTRSLPNLQRAGLPIEVVSWSVKEVAGFLRALGLAEWTEAFLKHRIQGDVMFSLTEATLAEMGVKRIGDRLYLVDCLQSLYEELTAWKQAKEASIAGKVRATVPALPGGTGAPSSSGGAAYGQAQQAAAAGGRGKQPTALLQQLLSQGYSMQEVLALAQQRPELVPQLFR